MLEYAPLRAVSNSDFQPFSSPSTHKLITKILCTPKNIFFPYDKIGIILIHSHWTAIVVLAVFIFLFDNLREVSALD